MKNKKDCHICNGTGESKMLKMATTCPTCSSYGKIVVIKNQEPITVTCTDCDGTGIPKRVMFTRVCSCCKGSGFIGYDDKKYKNFSY